ARGGKTGPTPPRRRPRPPEGHDPAPPLGGPARPAPAFIRDQHGVPAEPAAADQDRDADPRTDRHRCGVRPRSRRARGRRACPAPDAACTGRAGSATSLPGHRLTAMAIPLPVVRLVAAIRRMVWMLNVLVRGGMLAALRPDKYLA